MSTRNMLAIKYKDGTVVGMWQHFNGEPSWMMSVLNDGVGFAEEDLAKELIKFEQCEAVYNKDYWEDRKDRYSEDQITHLSNGGVILAGSGSPKEYKNLRECFSEDIEYLYVWKEGGYRWAVIDGAMLDELGE